MRHKIQISKYKSKWINKKILVACALIQTNQHNTNKYNLEKYKNNGNKISSISHLMTTFVLNRKTGELEKKISVASDLVINNVCDTKIKEVENKILDVSDLVKKANNFKISDIEIKYIITSDYIKFTSSIPDVKITKN